MKTNPLISFSFILLILIIGGCSIVFKNHSSTKLSPDKSKITEGNVKRVIDGDTILVAFKNNKEERVRMILIDTPETKHPHLGVEPFGPEASKYTKEKLYGKEVQLETDVQQRDKYGRLLAYIWVNGELYNEELINNGLARVAVFPPNTKYVRIFRSLQAIARKKKIGIWSIKDYVNDRGYNTDISFK